MADYNKRIKQIEHPAGNRVKQTQTPEKYYSEQPCWRFCSRDLKMWTFTEKDFFTKILPHLILLESNIWKDILIDSKKSNHGIALKNLNPLAKKRLTELRLELDSIISLRIDGTHRIYGFISKGAFYILWYDPDHGDNDTCVCRSKKRHT